MFHGERVMVVLVCKLLIDFQNVRFQCFVVIIAIKRQWCLECILKFEDFAKTIDFPL